MAPKRARTSEASSSGAEPVAVEYNAFKFKSATHQGRFASILSHCPIVRERGFKLQDGEYEELQHQMEDKQWQHLCKVPSPSCLSIVREFYTNAFLNNNENEPTYSTMVRGRVIKFDPDSLNRILRLPRPQQPCYFQVHKRLVINVEQVTPVLCKAGATWTLSEIGVPKSMKKKNLLPIPRAWCTFLESSLYPSPHHTDITSERMLILYAILNGNYINVGQIIAANIHSLAQELKPNTHLWYPSLITDLCQRAGVHFQGEPLQKPLPSIDASTIASYVLLSGGEPHQPQRRRDADQRVHLGSLARRSKRTIALLHKSIAEQRKLTTLVRMMAAKLEIDPDAPEAIPSDPSSPDSSESDYASAIDTTEEEEDQP